MDCSFLIDELIVRLHDLFHAKAFPELVVGILGIFDDWLRVRVLKNSKLPFLEASEAGADATLANRSTAGLSDEDADGLTDIPEDSPEYASRKEEIAVCDLTLHRIGG